MWSFMGSVQAMPMDSESTYEAFSPPRVRKSKKGEKSLYADLQPARWCSISKDENNEILIKLSKKIGATKGVIYIFENMVNHMLLIGKTGTTVKRRIAQYLTDFRSA